MKYEKSLIFERKILDYRYVIFIFYFRLRNISIYTLCNRIDSFDNSYLPSLLFRVTSSEWRASWVNVWRNPQGICQMLSCWLDFEIVRRLLFTNANSVEVQKKKFWNLWILNIFNESQNNGLILKLKLMHLIFGRGMTHDWKI